MGVSYQDCATTRVPPSAPLGLSYRWQSLEFRYPIGMDPDLPVRAVAAFERATGLTMCLHDIARSLWAYLEPERFEHTNPVCSMIKHARMETCVALDGSHLRIHARDYVNGVIKRCHAGIVEVAITVMIDGHLEWILFAGIHSSAAGNTWDVDDYQAHAQHGPWVSAVRALPTIDRDEAEHHLEMLRQLAARLSAWRQGFSQHLPALTGPATVPASSRRRQSIYAFIVKHHPDPLRIRDLAEHLGLSEDRTGHAVKEACDETFVELLTRIRIRTACGLLRFSDLPLREVAKQSGFADRGHFFAVFKIAMGTTPTRYRREHGAMVPAPISND